MYMYLYSTLYMYNVRNINQTLRVFHLSYFKYVLQISFNSFQFISSKFWKSVIFNLFEVSFSHFQWNRFLNKFFSEISMINSINTYFRSADYLFFILSGKWFHNFQCQLFIFYIFSGKWLLNFWYWIFWIPTLCEFLLKFKKSFSVDSVNNI